MSRGAPRSVLDFAIAKGGIRKGMRCATFIAQWTIVQAALEHEPTIDEAADWWRENRATWFRRQQEFREIFDALDNPAPIAAAAIADAQARVERVADVVAALGRMPLPGNAAVPTAG